MPSLLTISSLIVSFIVTLLITPYWIKRAKTHGLVGQDMHKPGSKIAELGGLAVICGFLAGLLYYIAIDVFVYGNASYSKYILAGICSVLIATIIGLTDDILGWKIGLRQYQKVILTAAIVFPMMVINSGHSVITIPFLGRYDIGLLYPLILLPIGIIGASNAFNMIAGYNGLEAGLGIIILSTLGYLSWANHMGWVAVMAFCMVAALLAFLIFNMYPASVFPGDTMTYSVGTLIAIIAILGNIEKFALVLFIPYFIELALKARGRMQKESFAKVMSEGTLAKPYKQYYGIEHIAIDLAAKIKGRAYEYDVVLAIWGFELFLAAIILLNMRYFVF
ncbi:glycosyl transferase family 4 [Candidatus Woesearchaeota archaeon CG10_big_fil_rev_8_21_14_0_10_44_13]|nr:MAG: glycosyl transferase family 4 [Candidatus Woesearchaeota archaeon CG10_big_fil_rev_8_21_14_0_10_44_13]